MGPGFLVAGYLVILEGNGKVYPFIKYIFFDFQVTLFIPIPSDGRNQSFMFLVVLTLENLVEFPQSDRLLFLAGYCNQKFLNQVNSGSCNQSTFGFIWLLCTFKYVFEEWKALKVFKIW